MVLVLWTADLRMDGKSWDVKWLKRFSGSSIGLFTSKLMNRYSESEFKTRICAGNIQVQPRREHLQVSIAFQFESCRKRWLENCRVIAYPVFHMGSRKRIVGGILRLVQINTLQGLEDIHLQSFQVPGFDTREIRIVRGFW